MDSCPNRKTNTQNCNCTYESCERKGVCCECVRYHRGKDQLPACFFPPETEKTFDRSVKRFIQSSR